jgi:DNA-binding transcriptional regulator YdaS (Cro superfamily)
MTELADTLGISQPYASQLMNGRKPWTMELALRIRRHFDVKVGPLADTPDENIPALEQAFGLDPAPPAQGAAA